MSTDILTTVHVIVSNQNTPTTGLYRPAFERENCGFGLIAQMESGVVYGLTAALYGEINIENGRVGPA